MRIGTLSKTICFVTKPTTGPRAEGTSCESVSTCNEPRVRTALAAKEGCRERRREWCPGAIDRWGASELEQGWDRLAKGHLSPQVLSVPTSLVSDHLEGSPPGLHALSPFGWNSYGEVSGSKPGSHGRRTAVGCSELSTTTNLSLPTATPEAGILMASILQIQGFTMFMERPFVVTETAVKLTYIIKIL